MRTARRVIRRSEELKSAASCGLPSKTEGRLRVAGGCVFAGPGILKCIAVVCVDAAIYCTVEAIEEILKK
jgi:hypothetical protein